MSSEITCARIRARFNEFPFLNPYRGQLTGVPLIQRMDLDLLEAQSWTSGWAYSAKESPTYMCSSDAREHLLLSATGKYLGQAKQNYMKGTVVAHKFLGIHLDDYTVEVPVMGDTVLRALLLLNDPDKIAYVLRVCVGYSSASKTLTLYKVPKGRTLSQWIKQLDASAADELKKHLAVIDGI